jgi:hypothetical protein
MKIVVCLVGTHDGGSTEKLRLESPDGKTHDDQRVVLEYIETNSSVLGLAYSLSGDGKITYSAELNQLSDSIVVAMRRVFRKALELI